MNAGSIVRRIGEERQYRIVDTFVSTKIGSHEREQLAVLNPIGESMVKRVVESVSMLVEVRPG